MSENMPTAISLFAGAGGCSLGFKNAGFKTLYATDIDKKAIETYKKNFPEALAECRDINEIDFNALLNSLSIVPGELDVLLGGPPCQGFSTAGTRFWDDPRNHLLKQYVRALEIIQPKWFMMENVEGLLTTKEGEYIYEAIKAFVKLGYHVRLEKVYIHEYGVPQRRKRVIILGNKSVSDFNFPKPISKSYGQIYRNGKVTIADALYGLPTPSFINCKLNYSNDFNGHWAEMLKNPEGTVSDHFSPRIDDLQLKRIQAIGAGETMRNLPPELQHASFLKRANRRVKDGTPSEKRGGPPSGLKRLLVNEPSLTITSAATREFIHPTENRTLTIRECARIQTFPDKFEFEGNQSDKIRQIGNAIPPLLAFHFACHIKSIGLSNENTSTDGSLIDFTLTKSNGFSPALKQTEILLKSIKSHRYQINLFEDANQYNN
jgi:DNA (cytosine-5)-methyltransferase 1